MSEFVKEELIPYVENKYRTYGDKEHRAMAGLSMGSLQTSITAFEHSELFHMWEYSVDLYKISLHRIRVI